MLPRRQHALILITAAGWRMRGQLKGQRTGDLHPKPFRTSPRVVFHSSRVFPVLFCSWPLIKHKPGSCDTQGSARGQHESVALPLGPKDDLCYCLRSWMTWQNRASDRERENPVNLILWLYNKHTVESSSRRETWACGHMIVTSLRSYKVIWTSLRSRK